MIFSIFLTLIFSNSSHAVNSFEIGAQTATFSQNAYPNWLGSYLRINFDNESDQFLIEADQAKRFDQTGSAGSLMWTHNWSDSFYHEISYFGSSTGDFWSKSSLFLELHNKFGAEKNRVLGYGFGEDKYNEYASDSFAVVELLWYAQGLVLQTGFRATRSYPGPVDANRAYLSTTLGYQSPIQLVLKYDAGKEAYQPIGFFGQITDFDSQVTSAQIRYLSPTEFGFVLGFEKYANPYYERFLYSFAITHGF